MHRRSPPSLVPAWTGTWALGIVAKAKSSQEVLTPNVCAQAKQQQATSRCVGSFKASRLECAENHMSVMQTNRLQSFNFLLPEPSRFQLAANFHFSHMRIITIEHSKSDIRTPTQFIDIQYRTQFFVIGTWPISIAETFSEQLHYHMN